MFFLSFYLLDVPSSMFVDHDSVLRLLDLSAVTHTPWVDSDVEVAIHQAHAICLHQHLGRRKKIVVPR